MAHTFVSLDDCWADKAYPLPCEKLTNRSAVQLAGSDDPFTVTLILAVCQLLGVLSTSLLSDGLGRRWLTLGLFGSGAISILAIGILGSFNYHSEQLGSVLVCSSEMSLVARRSQQSLCAGILGVRFQLWSHRRCLGRVFLRGRDS